MAYLGTTILMWLVLISDILIVLYLVEGLAIKAKVRNHRMALWSFFRTHAVIWAFIVALTAMLGSLYLSDILGYTPCKLCWYQRIFMYSQVFLFLVALWKKEHTHIWSYSLILSVTGGVIALFHYYIQTATKPLITIPCAAIGYSESCSEVFVTYFGYITIPLMALTAFIVLIILGLMARPSSPRNAAPHLQ